MPGSQTTPGPTGARNNASADFRGSMAGLYAPLPTLRRRPRGRLRTDRGRRGLLLLHRSGLSPHTPCQSPGALTRVAACTLAQSPYFVTAIRRLQLFRRLHACSGCFRLERSAGWGLHPLEKRRLVTAHVETGHWARAAASPSFPGPCRFADKGHLLPDFYSGATGPWALQ